MQNLDTLSDNWMNEVFLENKLVLHWVGRQFIFLQNQYEPAARPGLLILDFMLSLYSTGSQQWAVMPSELEHAMESLIMVFHRYAGKEGSPGTLSRRELRTLMESELSGFLKVNPLLFIMTLFLISTVQHSLFVLLCCIPNTDFTLYLSCSLRRTRP